MRVYPVCCALAEVDGFIRTAMTDVLPDAQKDALNARIPMGRMGAATLDDNNEAAMSDPFTYDASNIEQFKSIF